MKPILYDGTESEYLNAGIGVLIDAISCEVVEERNGAFELTMTYPVNGRRFSDIAVDMQILAKPNQTGQPQPFRIYNISKPTNGIVTINAEHISYWLSGILVRPFEANGAYEAFRELKNKSIGMNPFNFTTTNYSNEKIKVDVPTNIRSVLGGQEGSVLDVCGGEYEFDRYNVKLHANRGRDKGVVISYGKNLTGIKCEEKTQGIVTSCVAYWTQETDGEREIVIGNIVGTDFSYYDRMEALDCSFDFDEKPTIEQLDEKAEKYIQENENAPYFSVSVEFVNLGDTVEYSQYKNLETVELCDTITINHPIYGISVKEKVVKTVFDVLTEKYKRIDIGKLRSTIAKTVSTQKKEIVETVSQSDLQRAVISATNAITGNKGGYVVLDPPERPQRLLIMDAPNKEDAVNVWQWNLSGLGHSSSGVNGEYATAITADGQIVANFITAGVLSGDVVRAGVLSTENGNSYFSLDTGNLQIGGDEYFTEINSGAIEQYLKSSGGNIGGFVPIGYEDENGIKHILQGIFYDPTNETADGVGIFSKKPNGNFLVSVCFSQEDAVFYVPIKAPDVINTSQRDIKKNIQKTKTDGALEKVKKINLYDYELKNGSGCVKMGLMADEAPEEILSQDKNGISLYSYCGLLAKAVQELSDKISQLETGGEQ